MSDIIINIENFKRSSKRLQKALKLNGLDVGLTQSQDILAKAFGVKNTFEMLSLLNQSTKESSIIQKNDYDSFIDELESILKSSSLIKKAFLYTDYGNFIIDIQSHSEESYGIYFGATNNPSVNDFKVIGIDEDTSKRLVELSKLIPSDKYEGLLFGSNLFKKYCKNKNIYYFKNELFKYEVILNNKLYSKKYTTMQRSKAKDNILSKDEHLGYYKMKGNSYIGYNARTLSNPENILIEYYYEMHCFGHNSTCYAHKFFKMENNILVEISYENI